MPFSTSHSGATQNAKLQSPTNAFSQAIKVISKRCIVVLSDKSLARQNWTLAEDISLTLPRPTLTNDTALVHRPICIRSQRKMSILHSTVAVSRMPRQRSGQAAVTVATAIRRLGLRRADSTAAASPSANCRLLPLVEQQCWNFAGVRSDSTCCAIVRCILHQSTTCTRR